MYKRGTCKKKIFFWIIFRETINGILHNSQLSINEKGNNQKKMNLLELLDTLIKLRKPKFLQEFWKSEIWDFFISISEKKVNEKGNTGG